MSTKFSLSKSLASRIDSNSAPRKDSPGCRPANDESGKLANARFVDHAVDFIRFQIATMGRGPFTTLSLDTVPEGDA